jgi:hypothetical protein
MGESPQKRDPKPFCSPSSVRLTLGGVFLSELLLEFAETRVST